MKMDILKNNLLCIESGSRGKGGALAEGIVSIGAEHLQSDGSINWGSKKMKYISPSFYQNLKTGKIKKNDILIVKDGATTGKVAFVSAMPCEAAINEHVFLLRTEPSLYPKFLFYFLSSCAGNRRVMEYYHGATVGGIRKNFINILDSQKFSKKITFQADVCYG